jgi:hypothetical protein
MRRSIRIENILHRTRPSRRLDVQYVGTDEDIYEEEVPRINGRHFRPLCQTHRSQDRNLALILFFFIFFPFLQASGSELSDDFERH